MLVDYPSSDDDQPSVGDSKATVAKRPAQSDSKTDSEAQRKRPKPLPRLPSSFSPTPDDPSQHAGRIRARPFADGDYYAHVYVDLPNHLREVTQRMLALAPEGEAHAFDSLHISLSHPIPLRRHMRAAFVAEVKTALGGTGPFRVSLAPSPVVYYNTLDPGVNGSGQKDVDVTDTDVAGIETLVGKVDRGRPQPGGRAFLALVVGAGSRNLHSLLERVDAVLKTHHLPVYHANPELHTSLAWALVREGKTVPFPPALLRRLDTFADDVLAAQPKGGWSVEQINIKIAKEVTSISL